MSDFLPHGALVHIPLALAMLLPPMYLGMWFAEARSWLANRTWILLWLLCATNFICSGLAFWSGFAARVMSPGSPELMDKHQHVAALFLAISTVITMIVAVELRKDPNGGALRRCLTFAILVAQTAVGFWLGHLGGQLIH